MSSFTASIFDLALTMLTALGQSIDLYVNNIERTICHIFADFCELSTGTYTTGLKTPINAKNPDRSRGFRGFLSDKSENVIQYKTTILSTVHYKIAKYLLIMQIIFLGKRQNLSKLYPI